MCFSVSLPQNNSSAIVDHIFASNNLLCPAIPVYHLRDLIKRYAPIHTLLYYPVHCIILSLLCVCSMLLSNPKQRCTAETALLSPFFSIPFGMCPDSIILTPGVSYLHTCMLHTSILTCVCVCLSTSHWGLGSAALSCSPSAQPYWWQPSTQWWWLWRYSTTFLFTYLSFLPSHFEWNPDLTEYLDKSVISSLPDILDDMKEECQKYGSVVSLLIPKENPGKGQVRLVFMPLLMPTSKSTNSRVYFSISVIMKPCGAQWGNPLLLRYNILLKTIASDILICIMCIYLCKKIHGIEFRELCKFRKLNP